MGSINISRWLLGGIVAGFTMWLLEGFGSMLYMAEMETAMKAHGLSMGISPLAIVLSIVVSLVVGLTIVFFYAATRTRFGPGPRTAVLVTFVLFVGGYLVSLLGYFMIGLFPSSLLVKWGVIGLVEMIVAGLLGGWVYRES
jgi:hypothetical protein